MNNARKPQTGVQVIHEYDIVTKIIINSCKLIQIQNEMYKIVARKPQTGVQVIHKYDIVTKIIIHSCKLIQIQN